MSRRQLLSSFSLSVLIASCSTGPGAASPDAAAPSDVGGCVPDRAAWDAQVRALVQRQCGACHGATTNFGAPYSLLDYDFILRPRADGRPVDRIAARLMAGTMPPAGTPAPTDEAAQAIVQWASCGAQTPPPGRGLRASRPVFRAPERAPTGMEAWDLRAGNYPVAANLRDRYQCFSFTFPGSEARFIRRFELVADRSEVLHHVVLLRDSRNTAPAEPFECSSMPEGSDYLYAWAPGQSAFEFPDGGLRVTPGQRVVMQIHYNNGQGLEGVRDNSGVRIFHTAPQGTEYGMVAIGPVGFQIPPRSMGAAESACGFSRPSRILAGMPHMHQIGAEFSQDLVRAGGARESLISLQGWQFESQLFYDFGTEMQPGDRLVTRCVFNNTTPQSVRSGERTSDEMCFNFAYVTPAPTERYCDQAISSGMEFGYTPGACALPAAPSEVPTVMGRAVVQPAPALGGGELPEARWVLSGVAWYLNSASVGSMSLNLDETSLSSRGQLWTGAGRLNADFVTRMNLVITGGVRLARDFAASFGGSFTSPTSPLALTSTCGASAPSSVRYAVDGDTLTVGTAPTTFSGLTITPHYTFRRAR